MTNEPSSKQPDLPALSDAELRETLDRLGDLSLRVYDQVQEQTKAINHVATAANEARRAAKTAEQLFYAASFLPHKAWQMGDAILRTLFRMIITRRRLLEWETAAAVDSRLAARRGALFLQLAICSLVGLLTALFDIRRTFFDCVCNFSTVNCFIC